MNFSLLFWYKLSACEATQFTTEQNKTTSNELCRLCGFWDGLGFFPTHRTEVRELGQVRVFTCGENIKNKHPSSK